jgi:hypothetical protein
MEDAPTAVEWVKLKQYKPRPTWTYPCRVEDGLFFHVGIPPGSHQVEEFGGPVLFSNDQRYGFYDSGSNPTQIRIEDPGVYFLGSYRYRKTRDGEPFSFKGDRFTIVELESPTEEELLRRLLKVLMDDDPEKFDRQAGMIRRRLAEIIQRGDGQ